MVRVRNAAAVGDDDDDDVADVADDYTVRRFIPCVYK